MKWRSTKFGRPTGHGGGHVIVSICSKSKAVCTYVVGEQVSVHATQMPCESEFAEAEPCFGRSNRGGALRICVFSLASTYSFAGKGCFQNMGRLLCERRAAPCVSGALIDHSSCMCNLS